MKKSRKTKKKFKFDEFIIEVDVQCFGNNNLLQDFKFMKSVVKIVIVVWWNSRRKESVYKKKWHDIGQWLYIICIGKNEIDV